MNMKVAIIIAFVGVLAHAAVIPSLNKGAIAEEDQGEARTLGLLTAGANAVGSGIGTVGRLAAVAVGVIAAVKPLILLGLGKYALYKWLNKDTAGNGIGFSGGVNLGNDPQFYSDYNSGFAFSQEPAWVEQVDSGRSYVPADTSRTGWNKRK